MTTVQKRQTAYKVRIRDLLNGTYGKEEGEWEPSYVLIKNKRISRANIIGSIIDKYENDDKSYGSIDIDDGTSVIKGKVWREDIHLLENINVGDLALIIAKIKELNGERYLALEIIKALDRSEWAEVRKLELNKIWGNEIKTEEVKQPLSNVRQQILTLIENTGEITEEELLGKIDHDKEEVLKAITELIKEGEIYRPTPGCLKVV